MVAVEYLRGENSSLGVAIAPQQLDRHPEGKRRVVRLLLHCKDLMEGSISSSERPVIQHRTMRRRSPEYLSPCLQLCISFIHQQNESRRIEEEDGWCGGYGGIKGLKEGIGQNC